MELDEQPIPEETHCPNCRAKPTEESVRQHKLSTLGYTHDDVQLECRECDNTWILGIPIGQELEYGDDLWCSSCDDSAMLVHRVMVKPDNQMVVKFHLKCPKCYYFKTIDRRCDDDNIALVGYPAITGTVQENDPFGF